VASENRETRIPARIEDRLKLLEGRLAALDAKLDRLMTVLPEIRAPLWPVSRVNGALRDGQS
jgi:hypothetical protein